ncbi:AraC family transcriptional regulator [Flavobacterium sp. MMLR14_040]|uniref:helix-turn-helix transcriptional regulator n=1 Tax=Flavobacterium sp. MMLR14_040 TaxID=3093843 RepID=UPI0029901455|nr:AraC family transcriptional regulator [Flavobacterium sp. MMLR14_040]MDW8852389.1 AraC family transcriptional regulator [Flavobacterium sp. MMLR14_040]
MELNVRKEFGFLEGFSDLLGTEVKNGLLVIPETKGKGYLMGFRLDNSINMLVSFYEYNDNLLAKRFGGQNTLNRILFSFNNIFPDAHSKNKYSREDLPSIQIFKGKLNIETFYPGRTKFNSIFIGIDSEQLAKILGLHIDNEIFKNIINSEQSILFEELISPKIQQVALEIIQAEVRDSLSDFFFKIKAEELIYLTLKELFKRENPTTHALNQIDVQKIYKVRDLILTDINEPPVIKDLASQIGMSESKFKRLFKQIFGDSFFSYYQKFRMKEAARLLKENEMSVSQVGFSVGFSNLSHFAKVFEEHIGMKPKSFQKKK